MADPEQPDASLRWTVVGSDPPVDFAIFTVRRSRARHPGTGREHRFSIIDGSDWVNVIALTPAREVVLVRQYRHGIDDLTLEIPGGSVEPGEPVEVAAARELEEETGYTATRWVHLGFVHPNPAVQSNRCDTLLALDAQRTAAQTLDPGEVIRVELLSLEAVKTMMATGEISHSLVVAAFAHLLQAWGGWTPPP
jgi:ADP-ribose pyrophosphatase